MYKFLAFSLACSLTIANEIEWTGGGTASWEDPNSWTPTGIPAYNSQVLFTDTSPSPVGGIAIADDLAVANSIAFYADAYSFTIYGTVGSLLKLHPLVGAAYDGVLDNGSFVTQIFNVPIQFMGPSTISITDGTLSLQGPTGFGGYDIKITGDATGALDAVGLFGSSYGTVSAANSITINGGQISIPPSTATQGQFANLISGSLTHNGGSVACEGNIGPCETHLRGGSIELIGSGSITTSGNSAFTSGVLTSATETPTLTVWGTLTSSIPLGSITIHVGDSSPVSPNIFISTGSVWNLNTVAGGVVKGGFESHNLYNLGTVSPGIGSSLGSISILNNIVFDANSTLSIKLVGTESDVINTASIGSIQTNVSLNVSSITGLPTRTTTLFPFFTFPDSGLSGTFTNLILPSGYTGSISYTPTSALLGVYYLLEPLPPESQIGPSAYTAITLMSDIVFSGNCLNETALAYDDILSASTSDQLRELGQLPELFKVIQFSLEKLSFLLHRELDDTLYGDEKGLRPYLIAGYDNLSQKPQNFYAGYKVNSYYQMLGLSYGYDQMKWMGGVGVSESYMKVNALSKVNIGPNPGQASYTSVYGTLGISGWNDHWIYGLKALYGYSFLDTERKVDLLQAKAASKHNAWNMSAETRLAYKWSHKETDVQLYDSTGYIYGQENDYAEHGAIGLNMKVKDETISLIRNALGVMAEAPLDKTVKVFADVAWVYEHYLQSNAFKVGFVGSTAYAGFKQASPAENYGRVSTGLVWKRDQFEWKIAYLGLYGSKLIEQSGSLKFSHHF